MARWMLALLVMVGLLGLAAPALAEDCGIRAGEYFDADPTDEVVRPALALEVNENTCFIEGRDLKRPGERFDPYIGTYWAEFIQPLDGPPPYDKPWGCPFAPGDRADHEGEDGVWRPAIVEESDRACEYAVRVYQGAVAEIVTVPSYYSERLREATLAGPSPGEIAAARLCPPGGALADFADGSEDSMFRRAIITDLTEREKSDVHVQVEDIRYGTIQTASSQFVRDNPDAALNTELYPIRLVAAVCKEEGDTPQTSRYRLDFSCYFDKFGDFMCREEARRAP